MSLYKANVALLIKGDRREKGEEFELTNDEVAAFDPKDITLVEETASAEEEVVTDKPLEEMTHAELKARAKDLNLSTAGSVADLRERITLALAASAEGGE